MNEKRINQRKSQPVFQAIGIVEGRLSKVEGKPHLKLLNGERLKLSGIDPKLCVWLLTDDNLAMAAKPRKWLCYPQAGKSFYLVSSNPRGDDLKPGEFRICGSFSAEKNCIFVGRNANDRKGFSLVRIEGLPEGLRDRQPISLLAEMREGKLFFIKKIAPPSLTPDSNSGSRRKAS